MHHSQCSDSSTSSSVTIKPQFWHNTLVRQKKTPSYLQHLNFSGTNKSSLVAQRVLCCICQMSQWVFSESLRVDEKQDSSTEVKTWNHNICFMQFSHDKSIGSLRVLHTCWVWRNVWLYSLTCVWECLGLLVWILWGCLCTYMSVWV